jgi:hypothetical protein
MIDKQYLRGYVDARRKKDHDKMVADLSAKAYREMEAELWDAIEAMGIKGELKIDLGEGYGVVGFGAAKTDFGTIIDEEQAQEYFESRALTDEMTEPKVRKARLNSLVRDLKEANKKLPPGIGDYTKRYVKMSMKDPGGREVVLGSDEDN